MLRPYSLLTGALTLAAILACGAAQAASGPCPEAAGIVRAAYNNTDKPDAQGRIRLAEGHAIVTLSDADVGAPFAVACKVWPANPDLLLVAVPLMQDTPDPENGHVGDLDVLVLDKQTLEVRQRRRLVDLMSDDAVRIVGLAFDTARYDVAADQRAFGIRIEREGASRANPFDETSLRLFTVHANELRLVLDGMIVNHSSGEWDTTCAGEFSEIAVSLAIGDTQRRGYRNLIATESYSASRASVQQGGCEEKTIKQGKTRHTLTFDGKRYRIPKALRSMDRDTAG
ncbi:hypothetical protein LP085_13275 [Achromobacter sp. MY14]|uniref:hypothetical protein n=1 Tax=unclassified Achromobacter TaxID=2626865 RepID=UPI001E63E093|nr:hypothetical protein [Achromobacter sp. MY14]MCD0497831.1 hypothetical protein [Achromobacter sp. MY14]